MSAARQMKRDQLRNQVKVAEQAQQMGPYRIRAVQIVVELEFFSPISGKVTDRKATEPAAVYEAEFFPGLMDWLRSKGLTPVVDEAKPAKAEKPEKEAKAG